MNMQRILVAYTTNAGTTADVAKAVGLRLQKFELLENATVH